MECVALDVERLHLGIADFDTLFVGGGVERAVTELGIFLAASLALVVEAYCSSAGFESVREDARLSRGSCCNQGTGN
jgi:hypothetical protein